MKRPGRGWIVAGAAAAAAVAIGVPVLLLGGDTPDGGRQAAPAGRPSAPATTPTSPPDPTPSSATPSPSSPGPSTFRGTYDLLEAVTAGPPPAVSYLDRTTLVHPDGSTVRLPRLYDQFATLGDRILAGYDDGQGNRAMDVLDASGAVTDTMLVAGNFVVDATGGLAAWATPEGQVQMMWPGGELAVARRVRSFYTAALVGRAPCRVADDTCRVYLNSWGSEPPVSLTPDGTTAEVVPRAIRLRDVGTDRAAVVQVSATDTGSCSGVYDAYRAAPRWTTCDHSLFRFSPDGAYLLASDPYLDGLGLGSVTVLESRTGRPLVTFRIRGGFVAQQMWEDRTHPLVVVSGPNGWEVIRLSLDGGRERAVGPVPGGPDPAMRLVTLPGNV